jgi:hypothetical protein
METPTKRTGEEALSPRHPKKRRSTNLKIRLPTSYSKLLPDLLLIDVDDVAHLHHNDRRSSYLYRICSLLLDKSPEEIIIIATSDGRDEDDLSNAWTAVPNDEVEYEGGVYVCKPLTGIPFPLKALLTFSSP